MKVRILEGETRLINLRTRMPFKYGIATMTDVPYAFLRLHVEVDGQPHNGYSADNLPPKWFTKVPDQPLGDEMAEMLRVIEHARETAIGMEANSPFELWQDLADEQVGMRIGVIDCGDRSDGFQWDFTRFKRPWKCQTREGHARHLHHVSA